MKKTLLWVVPALLIVAAVAVGYIVWRRPAPEPPLTALPPRAEAPAPAGEPPPAVQYPIDQASSSAAAPPLPPSAQLPEVDKSDSVVEHALVDLLGRDAVLAFLRPNEYVRRFVVTVDNLARKDAAARLWPVTPAGGRLITEQGAEGTLLASDNARRYQPFVRFVESVDTAQAVALYVRLYPLCQRAYEELGFPGQYFNDRLITVIDHLLATPDGVQPIELTPPAVHGPYQPTRPWVMYRFSDSSLESRSAGQKLLIRMGPENARRLKAKLVEIRRQLVGTVPRQSTDFRR